MRVTCYGKTYEVYLVTGNYANNDSLAIQLFEKDGSPFATITVNLDNALQNDEYAFLDTNNCPWAEDFVIKNGLGEFTGFLGASGFCSYPLYQFDKVKLANATKL